MDAIDGPVKWIANFHDCSDADNFVKAYMELAKYDDCPTGYPIVKILHVVLYKDRSPKRSLVKTYYPNAYDCALVEVLESGENVR